MYTMSGKRRHYISASNFVEFWSIFKSFYFIGRLSNEFLVKRWQNIAPRLKRVDTLPCEILTPEKQKVYLKHYYD